MTMSIRKLFASAAVALALSATLPSPAWAADDHIINMQDVDMKVFIENVGIVTGRTFVIDPRVNGKVNIVSEKPLNENQVFAVFKEVLRVHGYTVVRSANGEYRVTLLQGAAQDAPLSVSGNGIEGQFATTILRVPDGKSAEAARLIKPVMHSQGQVSANPDGDIIVITDFAENLRKARAIVEAMGEGGNVRETIQLSQLSVLDAQEALKQLSGAKAPYKLAALEATNSLIVEGTPSEVAKLRTLLQSMDVGSSVPRGAISVVPLRFADGEGLNELIQQLLPTYVIEGQPTPTVAYEAGSNTLVISAAGQVQADLEQIIRQLDKRRPQVLVEAIIVEISDNAAKELGVQFALGGINGSTVPLLSSNFSRQAGNLLNVIGAIGADDVGLSETTRSAFETAAVSSIAGIDGGSFGVGGNSGDTLFGLIINALETDEDSNILSTPFVTTLDNVPATFLVGQEIPITTGESLGGTNINPFRTFERQEVGIQLDVLPQISDGDVVRLEIEQIVSSISGVLTSAAGDFVLNKREITTTVLANDGEIIVLGGLVQDDEQVNVAKVPILGDIPVAGKLFQSKGRTRNKTNLMVFLRPTIIRNAADARPLTQERLNQIRIEDLNQSGRTVSKIDNLLAPSR
ncbi:type II secretion system protein GspD [Litorimonas cladophorae]|uniref:Type II secretion system protein GspD n=2 Tax=Litorimonas cladophorae TaxID=1220491 RepID=A0A918KID5_9PROT|nr:type II secretion system protein GspD [Litorimonas cladophorae]